MLQIAISLCHHTLSISAYEYDFSGNGKEKEYIIARGKYNILILVGYSYSIPNYNLTILTHLVLDYFRFTSESKSNLADTNRSKKSSVLKK